MYAYRFNYPIENIDISFMRTHYGKIHVINNHELFIQFMENKSLTDNNIFDDKIVKQKLSHIKKILNHFGFEINKEVQKNDFENKFDNLNEIIDESFRLTFQMKKQEVDHLFKKNKKTNIIINKNKNTNKKEENNVKDENDVKNDNKKDNDVLDDNIKNNNVLDDNIKDNNVLNDKKDIISSKKTNKQILGFLNKLLNDWGLEIKCKSRKVTDSNLKKRIYEWKYVLEIIDIIKNIDKKVIKYELID